jgi:hypothetical protein
VEQQYPERYLEAKEIILRRTKTIRTPKGEREIKCYIGESIKGEDSIEKGVKLIYKAIHRKVYPKPKKQGLFICPKHGQDCPKDCKHLKNWMKVFNKRYMLFKPLNTTEKIF